jgi:hypothetical protein
MRVVSDYYTIRMACIRLLYDTHGRVSDYYTIRMAVYQIIIRYAVEHCVCRGRRLTRSVHVKGHNWKTCARIVAALQGMNHLDMPNSYFSSSSEKVCFLIPLSLLYI